MFKSYACNNYLGYNKETGLHTYEYKIVDTTFTETVKAAGWEQREAVGVCGAVINTYSKRNLNVSLNLLLCMRYIEQQYPWLSIDRQIEHNRKYVSDFSQYEKDINKYLSLI